MKECRKDRQKRLIEVYDHLRQHFGIHTKTGFAEAVKYGRTSMSAAINGKEEYLTDDLFANICNAYPGVFNLDYLLTGEGVLITPEEDARLAMQDRDFVAATLPNNSEPMGDMLEMCSRMIRRLDDLRVEMKQEIAEVKKIKEELNTTMNNFRDIIHFLSDKNIKNSNYSIGIAADSLI